MNWLRLMLGLMFLAIVLGGGWYFVLHKSDTVSEERVVLNLEGASFPTQSGEQVHLDDIRATIRIINFWASWSPSSIEELRALALLQEAYGKEVKVIAINRDATEEDGFRFLSEHNLEDKLLYLYDSADQYYKKLGGYNMPETVFINSKDEVLAHSRGPLTAEDLESILRSLLAQR